MAGVFLLLLSAVHMLMYWGLHCYPALRDGFMTGTPLSALAHPCFNTPAHSVCYEDRVRASQPVQDVRETRNGSISCRKPGIYLCAPGLKPCGPLDALQARVPCAAYYLTAAGAVVAGFSARSSVGRAAPMLVLFLVRVACLGVRAALHAGSQAAVVHYALAEVRRQHRIGLKHGAEQSGLVDDAHATATIAVVITLSTQTHGEVCEGEAPGGEVSWDFAPGSLLAPPLAATCLMGRTLPAAM